MNLKFTPQERNIVMGQSFLLCIALMLLSTDTKDVLESAGLFQLPTAKTLFLGIAFGVVGTTINFSIIRLLQWRKLEPIGFKACNSALVALIISLGAPFSEEIIFRGVIQPALGIAYTSIAFALVHKQTASLWNLLTSKMFMGFWFGFAFLYSGNLWVPIIAHFINNVWTISYGRIFFKELNRAIDLANDKRFPEALTILEQFPQQESNAYAMRWLSHVLAESGRFEESLKYADLAITFGDAYAHTMRGIANKKLQNFDAARADFDFICKRFPNLYSGWHHAGLLAVEEKRFDDALVAFQKARRINNTAIDLTNIGFTYIRMGKRDKAISFCKKALKKDPKSIICQKNFAAASSLPLPERSR